MDQPSQPPQGGLGEVGRYFLRLGFIAFGGPAAHVALMRRELVQQKKWVSDEEFVDMLGATNLIPGPNSTEMTMHLGSVRAGWWGLWLGGAAFILPAVAIVLVLAWAYVEWGTTPAGEALTSGIQPMVLAIIVQAIWGLRTAAFRGPITVVIGLLAAAASLAGVNEAFIVLGAGLIALAWAMVTHGSGSRWRPGVAAAARRVRGFRLRSFAVSPFAPFAPLAPLAARDAPAGYSLLELFLLFLKTGAVLYGSGYVLFSFLESDFVTNRGWLTEQELVDAISAGQFTPGPVFSSATFAGYVIDGLPGALVATLGLFIPSFLFVALTHPFIPRLRRSPWAAPFLDGVNAAAVALMATVTISLGRAALDDPFRLLLFAAAAVWLVRWSPNSAWLVLAGAAAGLLAWPFE